MSTKTPVFRADLAEAMAGVSWLHENKGRREKYKSLTENIEYSGHARTPKFKDGSTGPITPYIQGCRDRDRRVVEVLCETQMGQIRKMVLDEATQQSDIALFKKYAMKVIPRVYPALFIKDLITVQPIPLPVAKAFYKDFLRDDGSNTRLDLLQYFDRTYGNRGISPIVQPVGTPPVGVGPTPTVTNEGTAPKNIKLSLTSVDVAASSKAMAYQFSAELNQDLMAYHGTSADPELGAEAAAEIQREIEYDIVNALISGAAAGNVNWSATPLATDTTTVNIEAYNKTIFHAIVDARNLVFKKRYTYPNWMIAHPDFTARLEKLNGFEYDPSYNPAMVMQGRQFFGTIRNVIQIYTDPWFPFTNVAVLGYKGVGDFEVGLGYFPYIPFYSTQLFENPATLQSSRALLSRQAIAMLVPEMYATVTIINAS